MKMGGEQGVAGAGDCAGRDGRGAISIGRPATSTVAAARGPSVTTGSRTPIAASAQAASAAVSNGRSASASASARLQ